MAVKLTSVVMRSRMVQLLLVNTLACGLEICMAAGTTYVPPLLLEAGVEERFMTMVLGLGPVLGLVFMPLIGSASDQWTGRYGRRRPFIWALCLGVLVSLIFIPQASRLASLLSLHSRGLEVGLLIVGIGLLEFCGQVCFTPLEALVSDLFPEEEENRRAFSVYSLMISLGGCIGYLLPAINWNAGPLASYLDGQEVFTFTLLTPIFLACVLGTIFISEDVFRGEASVREGSPARRCCYSPWLPLFRPHHLTSVLGGCCTLLPRLYRLCQRVPSVIKRLFVAELCSWMALMTFILFYTDFVGEGIYKGVPSAQPGSAERLRYDEGVRMGSLGLFLQCATSTVCSLFMGKLVARLGRRAVYVSSVVLLVLATLATCLSHSVVTVTAMAGVTGYTFCTLQILPYTLTSLYHTDKQLFFSWTKVRGVAAPEKTEKFTTQVPLSRHSVTLKPHYSNGHPCGMPGLGPSEPGLPASAFGRYVSVPAEAPPCPSTPPPAGRGMCLDLAILDSAFLLSQVVPSLFLGTVVQFTHCISAYMGCASAVGLVAVYFSTKVIFDRSDLEQ
ncbi:solute carrier family 45 member 3 [Lepisosteus oculatus]|uniref:solute carrier family 45 member 3 n=1 Tax=Lepisosteus oculatus TaxID=7918 RepID=UPI00073FB072|nr:PREDICTED: solute carrier family 45 member 3 [Lepisosteus oculatus]XP_015198318.1 PREDICTED: solute carrier family 45 member 3 [Lepisosteus oculatus]XP_015198319.1 PREDICTED: solute carrier family 45 member 3 [Lepisosteus oculatus]XP_015198320.1 PREDICTED: solute carrier family 45 member 3 [Lepisosteus oculatus]